MGDLTQYPEAMKLPAAKTLHFRSFVSVPVVLSDGSVYGTFCAAGFKADKDLDQRDKALMDVLAHAASVVIEPRIQEANRRASIAERLAPVCSPPAGRRSSSSRSSRWRPVRESARRR